MKRNFTRKSHLPFAMKENLPQSPAEDLQHLKPGSASPEQQSRMTPNPKGIVSSSPGLRGTSYPGCGGEKVFNPNGVVSGDKNRGQNPVGVDDRLIMFSQGSSCLATLGFAKESRWDSSETSTRRQSRCFQLMRAGALLSFAILLLCFSARAELPEPDNILYGSITRGGLPVSAADTDVVIDARRTSDGTVVASYRMGDSARSGNYFTLRVPLEVFTPVLDPLASLTGTAMTIAASDFNGVFAEAPFTLGSRGQFHQVNLMQLGGLDSDGDGLNDEWEMFWFGNLLQSLNSDKDGDGVSDGLEYLAGTNPNDPNNRFRLNIQRVGVNGKEVSFLAQAASGAGYQSKTRTYTLESTTDLSTPVWEPMPGFVAAVGAGQTVRHSVPDPGPATRFYRVVIQLTEVGPPLP
jgi:hypothetical protein